MLLFPDPLSHVLRIKRRKIKMCFRPPVCCTRDRMLSQLMDRPLVRQFDGCFARASPVPPSQACSSANSPRTSQDIHQRVSNGTEKPFFCGPETTYPRLSNIHKRDLDTKLSLNAEMRILRVELPHSDGKSVLFFRRIPIIRFL